jgi:hypothetical protein
MEADGVATISSLIGLPPTPAQNTESADLVPATATP